MHEQIGEHPLWTLPFIGQVHSDTILTTWLVMALALLFFAWVGASYRSPLVTKRQTVIEGIVNYVADLVTSVLGEAGEGYVPFFIALFLFIFILNQFGMIPFKALGLPFGGSPTGDLNTTVPYAVMIFFIIQFAGFKKHGPKFPMHLFKPFPVLAPINILEEFARPATLAARLFFNIFVGELLFIIIASIVTAKVMIGPVNLSLALTVVPFFIQFFNFFVGTIQAFLFTLLAIVYLSLAVSEDH
ncbi:MAG: F0F1 ATP synthase subunit A [Candidatus Eremiobacteraeota bacterium]|nr:F0F1 ATP synthase subunit A [Candidatus Eremiobacteraeota bacterium]